MPSRAGHLILERDNAARSGQTALCGECYHNGEFGDVPRMTCAQPNRLRGARCVNPATLALGCQPTLEKGAADEERN
eukprot:8072217-Pyramimonas_sp.AAC.1